MKILMPYMPGPISTESDATSHITSKIVPGGIERFGFQLVNLFPEIEIVTITSEDRACRKTRDILGNAVARMDPDIILLNHPTSFKYVKDFELPTICIIHEPPIRSIGKLNFGLDMQLMIDAGVHIYYVSKRQFEFFRNFSFDKTGTVFTEKNIKGYVNPSHCEPTYMPDQNRAYDCVTVGRSEKTKDPFLLHRLAQQTSLSSLVITNKFDYSSKSSNQYLADNLHWKEPQFIIQQLPHDEVVKTIARCGVYVSTCPIESWGITAMEALACGVPLIINTDKTGIHSSVDIAASSDHYVKIHQTIAKHDFVEIAKRLCDIPYTKRLEISELTHEKHSKEAWKNQFEVMFNKRLDDKLKKSYKNLELWFS